MAQTHVSSDHIRQHFTDEMSKMYREEVPAYADLVDIVVDVNSETIAQNSEVRHKIEAEGGISTLNAERHGAIRVGKPEELNILRRAFAVMGMFPVGYYDLSVAGLPVHSTAFRPIKADALAKNPFRIFTSLLRLDHIADEKLRNIAGDILSKRQIVTNRAIELIEQAEIKSGLSHSQAEEFVSELLETFRWHSKACVDASTYKSLKDQHPLIADIVSFSGPHINHLTPRVLDIDEAQRRMPLRGLNPKDSIEGPPLRKCPILLRQTAFKALNEAVSFVDENDKDITGQHTARFGEIEQRGIALTAKGRALYDELLANAKNKSSQTDTPESKSYFDILKDEFQAFPDDWDVMRKEGLAYFNYQLTQAGKVDANSGGLRQSLEALISDGLVEAIPITYQDFLPVSAAGIFRSNLSSNDEKLYASNANQAQFEEDLGATVQDPFALYEMQQNHSIEKCLKMLNPVGCID